MSNIVDNTSSSHPKPNHMAFAVMTSLFLIWGFITALNDILIPHLKAAFDLSYTEAMLIQFCFFIAYFIISPLAGNLIEKIGFKRGIITGLVIVAGGCLLIYPAAEMEVYAIFLISQFILASGITILQVSANPYITILGPSKTAASRLNLAQAINSLGHTIAPRFGGLLIFGAAGTAVINPQSVQLPYLIIAGTILLTALVFKFIPLPDVKIGARSSVSSGNNIWKQKRLLLGAVAIFLYVGAEVSVGSFLVNYFSESHIGGMIEQEASTMVSYYWGAAMIGRFLGAALMRFISPTFILAGNAILAITMIIISINSTGNIAIVSIIAVGFFNSIMFPTIFSLAISGLGGLTSRGSGLLCQAIVGGAIIPLIQGVVADFYNVQISFIIPAIAYLYIAWYAVKGTQFGLINQGKKLI